MTTITDEYMYSMLPKTKEYVIVILKPARKLTSRMLKKLSGSMAAGILHCGLTDFFQLFVL